MINRHPFIRIAAVAALSVALGLGAGAAAAATGDHVWSLGFGFSGSGRADVTPGGDTVVYGVFFGTVDFGGGPITAGNSGTGDVFVVRFGSDGSHLWTRQIAPVSGLGVFEQQIAVDPAGNVYLAGRIVGGSVDLGGGPIAGTQGFLAKLDPAGNHLWSFGFGEARLLALDADAAQVVGAGFLEPGGAGADFGGGLIAPVGGYDVVVARIDADGSHAWSAGFGDTADQRARCIALDPSGNVAVAGAFEGNVDFGGGQFTAPSGTDVFLASFTAAGAHRWSRIVDGGFTASSALAVATGPAGQVALGGEFSVTADLGGGVLTSAGGNDVFLGLFDAAGAPQWSARYGSAAGDGAQDVSIDAAGNVMMTGRFAGATDFGGGPLPTFGPNFNLFLALYDGTGDHLFSASYGTTTLCANDFTAGGDIVLHGCQGNTTADFGGGQLTSARLFVARLAGPGAGASAIGDVPGAAEGLLSVHPNPFNPATRIRYELPAAGPASLAVYDLRGRLVDTVVAMRWHERGVHEVTYQPRAASGVYLVQLRAGQLERTIRITLAK